MIVGTAGHIDHGKTALVKALTGVDTDRLAEEKRRGITIDLGFAYRPLASGATLGFVDVPGHERFIHNMLAGAVGIDHMLLVVAADDGVMPQTVEHLRILDLLGVTSGAAVLTKIDRVAPARVAAVAREVEALLADTALAGCPLFAVSSVTGAGIVEVERHLASAAENFSARQGGGHFRLAIDRCFALPGHGTVVTGTAFAGGVAPGDELLVSPSGLAVRVRAIHAGNRPAAAGRAGERLALNLAGPRVEKAAIRRGEWLVAPALHAPSARFDARLRVLAGETKALGPWTPVHVHLGCADLMARIALLDGAIAPGAAGLVQVVLERPVPVLAGDRFIVRDQSAQRTVGGGCVIDPFAPARRRSRPERLAQLRASESDSPQVAAAASLALPPFHLDSTGFELARNLTPAQAEALWRELDVAAVDVRGRRHVIARDRLAVLHDSLLATLAERPLTPPEVSAALATPLPRVILEAVIETLVRERRIQRQGQRLALPAAVAAAAEDPLWQTMEALMGGAACRPLPAAEIARALKLTDAQALRGLAALAARGRVFRTAAGHYVLRQTLARLAGVAEALASDPAGIELGQFRARTGCSRRAAVEILEYFDSMGMTARRGEIRLARRSARDIFGF